MESDFIKNIKVEITEDLNEVYHKKHEYISASGLKKIKKSPAHFKEEKTEETEAMRIGSAYHTYILEPEKFNDEYFVFDETSILEILTGEGSKKPRATTKYKEWEQQQYSMADGKVMITLQDFQMIDKMQKVLYRHPYARSLISKGEAEKSVYCELETVHGKDIKVKIRPDYMKRNKKVVVDLKTTSDASKDGFQKNAAQYDYHIQAALYTDLIEKSCGDGMPWSFIFIAQEKKAPYAFNIFEASPQFIAHGRYEYELLLMLYQHCLENNTWLGYQVFCENKFGINELNLPPWAIKELDWFNHKY